MTGFSNSIFRFRHILIINYVVLFGLVAYFCLKIYQPVEKPYIQSRLNDDAFIKSVIESEPIRQVVLEGFASKVAQNNLFELPVKPTPSVVTQVKNDVPAPPKVINVEFHVVGVFHDEGGVEAIFQNKNTKETTYVRVGQSFDGFTLIDITENKVVLEKDNQRIELNKNGE